jgi:hypothetical protein
MSLVSEAKRGWSWFSRNDPYRLVLDAIWSVSHLPDGAVGIVRYIPMLLSVLMPDARSLMLPLLDWNALVIQ